MKKEKDAPPAEWEEGVQNPEDPARHTQQQEQRNVAEDQPRQPSAPDMRIVMIDMTGSECWEINAAYGACLEALETASAGAVKAFLRAVWRDPPKKRITDGALAAAGFVIGAAAADPVIGSAVATLGFFARNAFRAAFFHRKKKDGKKRGSSEMPRELQGAWQVACFRFRRIADNYNERVAMIWQLYQDAAHLPRAREVIDSAAYRRYEQAMIAARPRIIEIARILIYIGTQDEDERDMFVEDEDPFGLDHGRLPTEISWLDDDARNVAVGASKVAGRIREDLEMIRNVMEVEDFMEDAEKVFSHLGDHDAEDIVAEQRAMKKDEDDD